MCACINAASSPLVHNDEPSFVTDNERRPPRRTHLRAAALALIDCLVTTGGGAIAAKRVDAQ